MTDIQAQLFALQDLPYRDFNAKLIPNIPPQRLIGVRIPALRSLARRLVMEEPETADKFISSLPHYFLEENNLHAYIVSQTKDFELCLRQVERFLPYIDNWCTCDTFSPSVFSKNKTELLRHISRWIKSERPYTVRFALCCLMNHFLEDKDFSVSHLEMASNVQSEDCYVMMGEAWFFATALCRQWDATLPFIKERRLPLKVHNKAITKALESFRISEEHKVELRQYRIRANGKNGIIMETNY